MTIMSKIKDAFLRAEEDYEEEMIEALQNSDYEKMSELTYNTDK